MGGMSRRRPSRRIVASLSARLSRALKSLAAGARRSVTAAASSRAQCRKASTRVLVPASPLCPSVSITANGRPAMMYAKKCRLKLSGPQA